MARKIRLLVVGPTPPPFHGVSTFIRDLLAANHPRVETAHLDTSDRRDTSNIGRWEAGNIKLGLANLNELSKRCSDPEIDAVYVPISQNVPAFLRDALFIIQAHRRGKKVIVHLHGGYFRTLYDNEGGPVFRAVARYALRCTSAVMVLGKEFVPIFSGLVPDEKIHVVENGVPDPAAWELREKDKTHRPLTVLYMSTLTRTKGIVELVQAFALLRAKQPEVRLLVAGTWADDALRTEVEALIARDNIGEHIRLIGNVDGQAKAEFLAQGDIFCLPTRYPYEGQPLVLLEAMAAGLPVLSTNHGAIPSTVLDGVTGMLLSKDCSAREIADTLEQMLCDKGQLNKMSNAGRQRYVEQYTLEICHQRLLGIVKAVCAPEESKK